MFNKCCCHIYLLTYFSLEKLELFKIDLVLFRVDLELFKFDLWHEATWL